MNGITTQSAAIDESTESIGQRIVEAVAAETDADPITLDPLYETIDPEALDYVFHTDEESDSERRSRVVFTYAGCEVTVYGNYELAVSPIANETNAPRGEAQRTATSD